MADFVRWALAQLEIDLEEQNGIGQFPLAESDQSIFGGRSELKIDLQDTSHDRQVEAIDFDSSFGNWLVERLRSKGAAVNSRPREQPTAVQDISSRLFTAYRVEGGQVHLGGCQITEFPF